MRILSVDDREDNRYLVESLLKGHGFEVKSAANGVDALECLQNGNFDLIISDILMPMMDGFELCRRIRGDEKLRNIPFIVYTATYTGPQDEAFAMKIGADRFLVKPCEPDTFMDTIREVLSVAVTREAIDPPILPKDEEIFKLYNERLVRKLEQKMLELDKETTALREAEAALCHSERKYRRLYESLADGFAYTNLEGTILDSNESYRRMLGYSQDELVLLNYRDITPVQWHAMEEDIVAQQVLKIDSSEVYEKEYQRKDGSIFPVELRTFLVRDEQGKEEGMWAIVRDLTERKRLEKNQKQLEDQLHQAQKMESVGRLAGGVAHDYNNMLSVILGYTQMALQKTEPESSLHGDLHEILDAANRSANITRQLLAFARKQAIVREILDLNETVEGMLKMLRRLIGEDINLSWQPGTVLAQIKIDPSQIDQLLANLCVNARDAISGVGSIIIETGLELLDESFCALHVGTIPGEYILLAVSDNGCGMEKETLSKAFEPFFTTKSSDKGTGLGLATVYGIVKQNNGCICVYSEPGQGTTFKIYLPRYSDAVEKQENNAEVLIPVGKGETILIVEDETAILRLTSRILVNNGYTVLTANSPTAAIELASKKATTIDLVLSDVVMPGMNGRDLAKVLLDYYPNLKCLFMSGYTSGSIASQGGAEEGINFMQKPFSAESLVAKVAEMLLADVKQ